MHQGEDTDFYLEKGFKVIGFEADPDLAAHCRPRFSGAIADGRLVVGERAITEPRPAGPGAGPIKFYRNSDLTVWGTVSDEWARWNEFRCSPGY